MVKESLDYEFKPIEELPPRTTAKGSKYDGIVLGFKDSEYEKVKVEIESDKNANYLRTQLKKRLDAHQLNDEIEVTVINDELFIQRV